MQPSQRSKILNLTADGSWDLFSSISFRACASSSRSAAVFEQLSSFLENSHCSLERTPKSVFGVIPAGLELLRQHWDPAAGFRHQIEGCFPAAKRAGEMGEGCVFQQQRGSGTLELSWYQGYRNKTTVCFFLNKVRCLAQTVTSSPKAPPAQSPSVALHQVEGSIQNAFWGLQAAKRTAYLCPHLQHILYFRFLVVQSCWPVQWPFNLLSCVVLLGLCSFCFQQCVHPSPHSLNIHL